MTPELPGTRRTTVTVGTFDGIHRGHQAVLAEIVRRAREAGRAAVLVTFDPHPLEIVAPERAPALLTVADERRLLWPLFGLDYVHVVRFTEAVRQMPPEAFVRDVLVRRLRVGELVIGYDHGFGKDRSGNVDVLRRLGAEIGFAVDVVGPVEVDSDAVSSSRVRHAVESADFLAAERGLGRPYSALGRVERGAGRGRTLGFATANVRLVDPASACRPTACTRCGSSWTACSTTGWRTSARARRSASRSGASRLICSIGTERPCMERARWSSSSPGCGRRCGSRARRSWPNSWSGIGGRRWRRWNVREKPPAGWSKGSTGAILPDCIDIRGNSASS